MAGKFPEVCWRSIFSEYRDLMSPTTEASDAFHFTAFLARVGIQIGRGAYIYNAKPVYPNVQAVLVGKSYDDKKSTTITKAFSEVGTGEKWDSKNNSLALRMLHGSGSAEALLDLLAGRHGSNATVPRQRVALVINEFSSLMAKAKQTSIASLLPLINESYDCPDVLEIPSRSHSGIRAEEPFLCILAGSTESWLEASIDGTDIMSGFVNRFLFVIGEPKPANPLPPLPDPAKLNSIAQKLLSIEKKYISGPSRAFVFSEGAERSWCKFYMEWRDKKWAGDLVSTVVKRVPEYIIKLSLVYAVSEDSTDVTLEQMEAAIAFGWWAAGCGESIFSDFSETKQGKVESRITKELSKDPRLHSRRDVRIAIGSWCSTEEFNRAWDSLNKCQEIKINVSDELSNKTLWQLA